jgi:hypothetical protein
MQVYVWISSARKYPEKIPHVFDVFSPVACYVNTHTEEQKKMPILFSSSKVCISQCVPFLKKDQDIEQKML